MLYVVNQVVDILRTIFSNNTNNKTDSKIEGKDLVFSVCGTESYFSIQLPCVTCFEVRIKFSFVLLWLLFLIPVWLVPKWEFYPCVLTGAFSFPPTTWAFLQKTEVKSTSLVKVNELSIFQGWPSGQVFTSDRSRQFMSHTNFPPSLLSPPRHFNSACRNCEQQWVELLLHVFIMCDERGTQ